MRKLLFLFILCIGATNLLYAQNESISDTTKIKKPPVKLFPLSGNNIIAFSVKNYSIYLFSIKKNGEEIFNDEVSLGSGDNYFIDLSSYPAGTYRVIIRDIIYSKEYEYFFTKQNENTELF